MYVCGRKTKEERKGRAVFIHGRHHRSRALENGRREGAENRLRLAPRHASVTCAGPIGSADGGACGHARRARIGCPRRADGVLRAYRPSHQPPQHGLDAYFVRGILLSGWARRTFSHSSLCRGPVGGSRQERKQLEGTRGYAYLRIYASEVVVRDDLRSSRGCDQCVQRLALPSLREGAMVLVCFLRFGCGTCKLGRSLGPDIDIDETSVRRSGCGDSRLSAGGLWPVLVTRQQR